MKSLKPGDKVLMFKRTDPLILVLKYKGDDGFWRGEPLVQDNKEWPEYRIPYDDEQLWYSRLDSPAIQILYGPF